MRPEFCWHAGCIHAAEYVWTWRLDQTERPLCAEHMGEYLYNEAIRPRSLARYSAEMLSV